MISRKDEFLLLSSSWDASRGTQVRVELDEEMEININANPHPPSLIGARVLGESWVVKYSGFPGSWGLCRCLNYRFQTGSAIRVSNVTKNIVAMQNFVLFKTHQFGWYRYRQPRWSSWNMHPRVHLENITNMAALTVTRKLGCKKQVNNSMQNSKSESYICGVRSIHLHVWTYVTIHFDVCNSPYPLWHRNRKRKKLNTSYL